VLEADAATNASMIHEFVEATARGERPTLGQVRTDPAAAGTERSVGLLDETLHLMARGLGAVDGPRERVVRIASKSKPGEFNEVTVLDDVARCSCTGFQYRGNCSHAQKVAAQVAAGSLV
jgi:SWIM zinc finger